MPSQNQAANRAIAPSAPKWNLSRCSTVASSVSVENTATVTTAIRASTQACARRPSRTSTRPAAYPAPRNAAVSGGLIVQAKYASVCADRT